MRNEKEFGIHKYKYIGQDYTLVRLSKKSEKVKVVSWEVFESSCNPSLFRNVFVKISDNEIPDTTNKTKAQLKAEAKAEKEKAKAEAKRELEAMTIPTPTPEEEKVEETVDTIAEDVAPIVTEHIVTNIVVPVDWTTTEIVEETTPTE